MLHLVSSEALSALVCLFILTVLFASCLFRLPPWAALAWPDRLVLLAGCAFACRGLAGGRPCAWPAGAAPRPPGEESSERESAAAAPRAALVTGASSGVGREVARALAERGWTVIMAGRHVTRLLDARREIMRKAPAGRLIVLDAVDLADLDSVRHFASSVLAQREHFPLGLLVNAAGVLRRKLHRCEGSGMEEMIATNAVGPMLLTELLLPLLDETAESSGVMSRIVNVASSCHTFLGIGETRRPMKMIEDLHDSESPQPTEFTLRNFVGYYGLSKLCVVWWTAVLAKRLASRCFATNGKPKIFVACCHPGVITTHLYRDLFPIPFLDYVVYYPSLLIGKTWREGAQAVLKVCVEEKGMVSGGYYLCSGEYGRHSGFCCLSRHALDMFAAASFSTWAEAQIEHQKQQPKVKKTLENAPIQKKPMFVKIL